MDREALIDTLKAMNAATFLEEHVFDSVPHVSGGDRGAYIGWKRALGAGIDVDPACLMVIGSAAVGCSLNPSKNIKPFDDQSDVDVAVISNHYFTIAWRYLRMNGARRLKVDQRTRNAWDEHVKQVHLLGHHRDGQVARHPALRLGMDKSNQRHGLQGPYQGQGRQFAHLCRLRGPARLSNDVCEKRSGKPL